MLLYFQPGACSLASRIVLTELGLPFQATRVLDAKAGATESGVDFRTVNPKGYVPALEIEPGVVITENPAVLQYIGDRKPEAGLVPPAGALERVRLQEWLNFASSELHKAFGPYFTGRPLEGEDKARCNATIAQRIGDVERGLSDGRPFILGEHFSVADAYIFVILNWTNFIGYDLSLWPHVVDFMARVGARSAVKTAMAAEGLLKAEAAG